MAQWTQSQGLKEYGAVLLKKMGIVALGWVVVFFISQPFRQETGMINVLILFSPMIGAFAGVMAGWYIATDAVEDSGMTGLGLWAILVAGSWIPMWVVEGILHLIFRRWGFGFGAWIMVASAMVLAMAAAVWHAATQE